MAVHPKDGKLIYHLTSLDNLPSILKKGLLPRDLVKEFIDVADQEIINLREEQGLNGLVPFHFFPKNPFDGKVQKDNRTKKFIFITVHREFAKLNGFKIIPQHPLSIKDGVLLDYDVGMNEIEWEVMARKDYHDDYCQKVCMAECLSTKIVKPMDFQMIAVPDNETKLKVLELMQKILGSQSIFHVSVMNAIFVQ